MTMRSIGFGAGALALLLLLRIHALADEGEPKSSIRTHQGKVVKAENGQLIMTDKSGKNKHTHDVAKTAKITCDGKDCKLEDLKKGFGVRVTTEKEQGKTLVTKIQARTDDKTPTKKESAKKTPKKP